MATKLVCMILIFIVAAIVAGMIRDKKKGKALCGCGCSGCSMNKSCDKK